MKPDHYPSSPWTDAMIDALAYGVSALSILAGAMTFAWHGWAGVGILAAFVAVRAGREYRRAFPRTPTPRRTS